MSDGTGWDWMGLDPWTNWQLEHRLGGANKVTTWARDWLRIYLWRVVSKRKCVRLKVFMSLYLKVYFQNICEDIMWCEHTYMQLVILWILILQPSPFWVQSHYKTLKAARNQPNHLNSSDLMSIYLISWSCGENVQHHWRADKVGIKRAFLPQCPASGNNPLRSIVAQMAINNNASISQQHCKRRYIWRRKNQHDYCHCHHEHYDNDH